MSDTKPAPYSFSPEQRTTLLAHALAAFIPLKLETMPPRGEDIQGKTQPGRYDRCAAAWALETVEALEYRIRSNIEYREKKAREARERMQGSA